MKDENEESMRSMRSTLTFGGVPENKQRDAWKDVSRYLISLLSSRLNIDYDELYMQLSRVDRTPKTRWY